MGLMTLAEHSMILNLAVVAKGQIANPFNSGRILETS